MRYIFIIGAIFCSNTFSGDFCQDKIWHANGKVYDLIDDFSTNYDLQLNNIQSDLSNTNSFSKNSANLQLCNTVDIGNFSQNEDCPSGDLINIEIINLANSIINTEKIPDNPLLAKQGDAILLQKTQQSININDEYFVKFMALQDVLNDLTKRQNEYQKQIEDITKDIMLFSLIHQQILTNSTPYFKNIMISENYCIAGCKLSTIEQIILPTLHKSKKEIENNLMNLQNDINNTQIIFANIMK